MVRLIILLFFTIYMPAIFSAENYDQACYKSEQSRLHCLIKGVEASEVKINSSLTIKIYKVKKFDLFNNPVILDLKNNEHAFIIDIGGLLIYGTGIYNDVRTINPDLPVLILRKDMIETGEFSDCRDDNSCRRSSSLLAYGLTSPLSSPAIIDVGYNFSNRSTFGFLTSHDLTYDRSSLTWDEKRLVLGINARFIGPPDKRLPVHLSLQFDGEKWSNFMKSR